MIMSLTRAYVKVMHGLGETPLFPSLDQIRSQEPTGRIGHWFASLPAIHNLDRMIALDSPWWTYHAIDEVDHFLRSRQEARVFEWGSGASTVWLAKRTQQVISIEHDEKWHTFLSERIDNSPNASITLIPPNEKLCEQPDLSQKPGWKALDFSDYAASIRQFDGQFDLIVIDGRVRSACLRYAVDKLADDGMVVFDNSHRRRYREAIALSGLDCRRMRGLTPSLPYPDETSLLTRRG